MKDILQTTAPVFTMLIHTYRVISMEYLTNPNPSFLPSRSWYSIHTLTYPLSLPYSSYVVRVWDTRAANVPLGSTSAHEGKALCIDWLVPSSTTTTTKDEHTSRVISGGSDCVVRASSVV